MIHASPAGSAVHCRCTPPIKVPMQPKIFRFPFSLKAVYASWLWCMLRNVLADARPQNVTIDDRDVAVKYSPFHDWAPSPCGGCQAQPDPSRAFGGTWHDSTIAPGDTPYTVTYSFTGRILLSVQTASLTLSRRDSRLRFLHSSEPSSICHNIFKSFFYSRR